MGFRSFYEQTGGASEILGGANRVSDDVMSVFGRHNPPHLGHKLTLDHASGLADNIGDNAKADQRFYTSHSQDRKKNPLPFDMKLGFLKKMFPDHAEKWDGDDNVRTVLGAATKAHQDGYKNFHFVGGSDRRQGMEDLLRRYNGNLYDFDNIYSHSAGERDEEGLGDNPIAKLSASLMRRHANNDDFDGFMGGLQLNDSFTSQDARQLFDAVQTFGQKNEDWQIAPRYNKEFIREMYRDGLFQEGDIVESLTSGLVGKVHRCGTNHLICVTEEGIMFKNFVHDVELINI